MLPSFVELFFGSARGGAIPPSRPADGGPSRQKSCSEHQAPVMWRAWWPSTGGQCGDSRGATERSKPHTTRRCIASAITSRTCLAVLGLAPPRHPLRPLRHTFFPAICCHCHILARLVAPDPSTSRSAHSPAACVLPALARFLALRIEADSPPPPPQALLHRAAPDPADTAKRRHP
jgi:hypothetical protein